MTLIKPPTLQSQVINVNTLLQYEGLHIPPYQRPYKWTIKNVSQLFFDITAYKDKSAYRLGTIVIHDDGHQYNIVDGQQRTITLILMVKAILKSTLRSRITHPKTIELLAGLEKKLFQPQFQSDVSIQNIQDNYREIARMVETLDEKTVNFLLTKCEFTQFVLSDISEAFQFFDSQNARGKDLEPHDLLKAYHLREFTHQEKLYEAEVVATWEGMRTEAISQLFGEYLFRIKGWCKGESSRYFTKNEVSLFKGINIHKIDNFPYTEITRIAHFYIDHYNGSFERNIDRQQAGFPFQIDQMIINGKRFFEMVAHYKLVLDQFNSMLSEAKEIDTQSRKILETLKQYEGSSRTGDGYIKMLFDCAILYYIDKFGFVEISRVIEKLFIWAYRLRLRHQAVYLASVDNYVVQEINIFKIIKDAQLPHEILTIGIPPTMEKDKKATKVDAIVEWFKTLKYYES